MKISKRYIVRVSVLITTLACGVLTYVLPIRAGGANPPATRPTTRPVVYIASPYTKGDPAINTHFQCELWDKMMTDGKVWPVAPLWSHFQHTTFPRKYEDWVAYDLALIARYDA